MSSELQMGRAWSKPNSSMFLRVSGPQKKLRRFYFHYNKPASKGSKLPVLSIHWNGKCNLVNSVVCPAGVPFETHAQNRQPRCVVRGFAREVIIIDFKDYKDMGKTAYIYA